MLLDVTLGVIQCGPNPAAVPNLAAELHRALVTLCVLEISNYGLAIILKTELLYTDLSL